MTNKEFKERVVQAKEFDWFNTVEVIFKFPSNNREFLGKGLPALYSFITKQVAGWNKLKGQYPDELNASSLFFYRLERKLSDFVNNQYERTGTSYLNSLLHDMMGENTRDIMLYDSPEVEYLINVHRSNPKYVSSLYSFLCGQFNGSNTRDVFGGNILGYEFRAKETEMQKRIDADRKSLSRLRNDFEKSLLETESQLTNHLKNSNDKYAEYSQRIDDFQSDKEKTYSDWFITTKGEFEIFSKNSTEKINDIESTYKEKLKLEEPAVYWSKRANSLRNQGWFMLGVLIVLLLAVVISLGELLWKTPQQIYTSFFDGDKSAAIRWSIIYVTFISFMAFCIKAVSKVMFSSFHLARDCEERHTLTYFYLALLKDSAVSDNEKQLIIQSLFSRAETGLLKDDSTPAMPSDLLGKAIK